MKLLDNTVTQFSDLRIFSGGEPVVCVVFAFLLKQKMLMHELIFFSKLKPHNSGQLQCKHLEINKSVLGCNLGARLKRFAITLRSLYCFPWRLLIYICNSIQRFLFSTSLSTFIIFQLFITAILTGVRWYRLACFAFSWGTVILSIFSCISWPFVCLLLKSVYSILLPVFKLDYLFPCYWVMWIIYIFWILAIYQIYSSQIFSLNSDFVSSLH